MPNDRLAKLIAENYGKILFTICLSFYPVWHLSSSLLLTIITLSVASILILFTWFNNTNLSVEITLFLAKVFPDAIKPVWDTKQEPYNSAFAALFRDNYKVIHSELLEYEKHGYLPQFDDVYPNGSIVNFDRKWHTVTLRCYGKDNKVAKFFPKTMEIVNKSSIWLTEVMFSYIEPYKFIPRHRGPYSGVFRYQLSLEIPPNVSDPEKDLYLAVWPDTASTEWWDPNNTPKDKPQILGWTPGSDFLFDDICVHEVRNNTPYRRIILFIDVERQDVPWISRLIHRFFMLMARFMPAIIKAAWEQDKFLDATKDEIAKMKLDSRSSTTMFYNEVQPFMLPWFMAKEIKC
eukprot:288232_1